MKFLAATPMLITSKLRETIDFYTDILGFNCEGFEDEWGWVNLKKDEIYIMLSSPNDHDKFNGPHFTGSIYFRTNDVDAIWEKIKGKVKVCYPLEDFEYGMREFAIYDNNGYLLQFGKEIP